VFPLPVIDVVHSSIFGMVWATLRYIIARLIFTIFAFPLIMLFVTIYRGWLLLVTTLTVIFIMGGFFYPGKTLYTGKALTADGYALKLTADASGQPDAYVGGCCSVVPKDPAVGDFITDARHRKTPGIPISAYDPATKVVTLEYPFATRVNDAGFTIVDDSFGGWSPTAGFKTLANARGLVMLPLHLGVWGVECLVSGAHCKVFNGDDEKAEMALENKYAEPPYPGFGGVEPVAKAQAKAAARQQQIAEQNVRDFAAGEQDRQQQLRGDANVDKRVYMLQQGCKFQVASWQQDIRPAELATCPPSFDLSKAAVRPSRWEAAH
jgi:hypothetical protein